MDVLPGPGSGTARHPTSQPSALADAQLSPESRSGFGWEGGLGGDTIVTCDARVSILTLSGDLAGLPGHLWLRPLADPLSFPSGLVGRALGTLPQPVSHLPVFASLT